MSRSFADVRGVLLDVDGTLLDGDVAVRGAADAVDHLRGAGLSIRAVTNTTRRPRTAVAEALSRAGIVIETDEILIPARLARRLIVDSGRRSAALLVPDPSKADFDGVREDETAPHWVVVGDLGRGFDFDRLDAAFRWIRGGARLLALQKNRYWKDAQGVVRLDAGPFVAALEFAAGVEAEVVGKPSAAFFRLALADLGLPARDVLMVGDSPDNDVAGAAAAGCRTALVRTGLWRGGPLPEHVHPDRILESVADLEAGPAEDADPA